MQRNKGKGKIIRNIILLAMMLVIVIGVYYNIRNSRASETMNITASIWSGFINNFGSDTGKTIKATAQKNSDGTYNIQLPVYVDEQRVKKYILIDEETKAETTLDPTTASGDYITVNKKMTSDEIKNKKIRINMTYDTITVHLKVKAKREVTVPDPDNEGQTITQTEEYYPERTLYYIKHTDTEKNVTAEGYMLENATVEVELNDSIGRANEGIVKKSKYSVSIWKKIDEDSLEETEKAVYYQTYIALYGEIVNGKPTIVDKTGTKETDDLRIVATDEYKMTYYEGFNPSKYQENIQPVKITINVQPTKIESTTIKAEILDVKTTSYADTQQGQGNANYQETEIDVNKQINGNIITANYAAKEMIEIRQKLEIKNLFIGKQGTASTTNTIKYFGNEQKTKYINGTEQKKEKKTASMTAAEWELWQGILAGLGFAAVGSYGFYLLLGGVIGGVPALIVGAIAGLLLGIGMWGSQDNTTAYFTYYEWTTVNIEWDYTPFMGLNDYYSYITGLSREDISRINFTNTIPDEYTIGYSVAKNGIVNVYWNAENYTIYIYSPGKIKIEDASYLFANCNRLLYLDLSNVENSSLSGSKYMFYNCANLTEVNLNMFNFKSVTDASYMFAGCTGIKNVQMEQAIFADSLNATNMFQNIGKSANKSEKTNIYTNKKYYISSERAKYGSESGYKLNTNYAIFNLESATLQTTKDETSETSKFLGGPIERNKIRSITFTNLEEEVKGTKWKITGDTEGYIYGGYVANGNLYDIYIGSNINIKANNDSSYMFANMTNLVSISGFGENIDTATILDANHMFYKCKSLTSLDLRKFESSNVSNMSYMFSGCSELITLSIDTSKFLTNNVINMTYMFSDCKKLTAIDVSKFNTDRVTNMSYMFNNCSNITTLNVSNFNTTNVTDMAYMFNNCSSVANLNVSGFNTGNVRNMAYMFSGCSKIKTLDVTNFNTANVTDISYMFNNCTSVTTLNVSGFNTGNVIGMAYMFNNCSSVTNLNVSSFNTANVIRMEYMFNNCSNITTLTVNAFDTSNVINFEYMFSGCSKITTLNLGDNFWTKSATKMTAMFKNCTGLQTLDLGPAFIKIEAGEEILNNTGTSSTTIYCGEAVYGDSKNLRYGPQNTVKIPANGKVVCKYYIKVEKISSTISTTNKTLTVVYKMTVDDVAKYNTLTADASKLTIYADGEVTKGITKKLSVSQISGGVQYTLVLSNFEQASGSENFKEWSGNIGVKLSREILVDKYGNGNLDDTLKDTDTNKNTTGKMFVDYINPVINYTYASASDINKSEQMLTIQFTVDDKYIDYDNSTLSKADLKMQISGYDASGNSTWEDVNLSSDKNTLEKIKRTNGITYVLKVRTLPQGIKGKYGVRSGYVNLIIPKDKVVDYSGNKNAGKTISVGINVKQGENDKNNVAQIVDVIPPTWQVENVQIHNKNKETGITESYVTADIVGTDKYYGSNSLTIDKIKVKVEGEEVSQIKKEIIAITGETAESANSKGVPVYETRDGKQEKIGIKYRIKLSNFEKAEESTEDKYLKYSGNTVINVESGTLTDTSSNVNVATDLNIGVVDFTRPVWKIQNVTVKSKNIDYSLTESYVLAEIVVVDRYISSSDLTVNDIEVITGGSTNSNIKKEFILKGETPIKSGSYGIPVYENRNGTNTLYGIKYYLKLSNFEESTLQTNKKYYEYSGNVSIKIKEEVAKDTSDNKSKGATLSLGEVDVIAPKIKLVSATVDTTAKTETIKFEVTDKYFDANSSLSANSIKVYVDNEEAGSIKKTLTSTTITDNGTTIGKQYTLVLSEFEQTVTTNKSGLRNWSGTVKIEIPQGSITDKNKNGNENTQLEGKFVDFIKPVITYTYYDGNIKTEKDEVTVLFEVTDKYYSSGSISISDLNIVMTTDDKRVYNLSQISQVKKELNVSNKLVTTNITKNGKVLENQPNQIVGKIYELKISNLSQAIKATGENTLNYSGALSVGIKKEVGVDTSGNSCVGKTITVGINNDSNGNTSGDKVIVDTVKPVWEMLDGDEISTTSDGKMTASVTIRGTDTYYQKSTLVAGTYTATGIKDKIKIYKNNTEVNDSSISVQISQAKVLQEDRVENGVTGKKKYGVEYTITISGFETNANQLRIEMQPGTLEDTSGNLNERKAFLIYNTLISTKIEDTVESTFLGMSNVQRNLIESITIVNSKDEVKGSTTDVSAQGDNSILAGYVDENKNGKYEVYIGSNDIIYGNRDSSYLFANLKISSISGIDKIRMTTTEDFGHMFENDANITSLTLSFNTKNATDMSGMFNNCTGLTTLNLGSKFDTSKVTNMQKMFNNCANLTGISLGDKFNTGKVTNMSYMFSEAKKITTLNLGSSFNTANVTDMSYMFNECNAVTSITLGSNFNTSKVTNMQKMFNNCGKLTSLALGSSFNTGKVTNMQAMFNGCASLTSLNLGGNFDTTNVTDMSYMFSGCEKVGSITLGNSFNTGKVTTMEKMFNECKNVTSINLGGSFDTTNVTDMSYMFNECNKATSITLGSKFNTNKVTNMSYMFSGCSSLGSLSLGTQFNTSSVSNMSYMFNNCSTLTILNLGTVYSTTNVKDMSYMFNNCAKLTSLSLNFDTVKVENMEKMFNGCSSMTTLSLGSKFKTTNVNNMNSMFANCTSMKSLDLGPAFTRISENNNDNFVQNLGSSSTIVYVGEAIYESEKYFKLNETTTTTINYAIGKINCKYRLEWRKVSSSLNASTKVMQVVIEVVGVNTTYKANTANLTVNNIHVLMDGVVADDISKSLSAVQEIDGGARYTVTLSNFEQGVKKQKYKEWSGNVSLRIDKGKVEDIYGNGAVEALIQDDEQDRNTTGKMFIDYIKPDIMYESSTTVIDHENQALKLSFDAVDKYIDETNSSLSLGDIKLRVEIENDQGKTEWKEININDAKNSLTKVEVNYGMRYVLTVRNFEQEMGEKYRNYSGYVSIVIPANKIQDLSGNLNPGKTITVGINSDINDKETGNKEIVDVVRPVWQLKEKTLHNKNLETGLTESYVDITIEGTDRYFKQSTLTADMIGIEVDDKEETRLEKKLLVEAGESLKETRAGKEVEYGRKYVLRIKGFESIECSGEVKIIIPEGIMVDNSGNKSEEKILNIGIVDFIKPKVEEVSSIVDSEAKEEIIVFNVTDKYFAGSTLKAEDIKIYVDEEDATASLIKELETTDIENGKSYQLRITGFEQTAKTTGRKHKDWSGTVRIEIPKDKILDKTGNKNDSKSIQGKFADFINPEIDYQYTVNDINKDTDSVKIVFDITDKYYTDKEISLSDLTIKMAVDDTRYDILTDKNVELSLTSVGIRETINKTKNGNVVKNSADELIGKKYTLTISKLSSLIQKANRNTKDYSGTLTVAIKQKSVTDTNNNGNIGKTLTVGISSKDGKETGTAIIVDTVKPEVKRVDKVKVEEQSDGKTRAILNISGVDTYFESSTLVTGSYTAEQIKNKIKVYVNGKETSTGITVNISDQEYLTEKRYTNKIEETVRYGVKYKLTISGLNTEANKIEIEVQEGVVKDNSENVNEKTKFIIYSKLKTTSSETAGTSTFLGISGITRQQIEKIVFVDSKDKVLGNTKYNVAADGGDSIIAGYVDSDGNGKYEVYVGSDGYIFANNNSSYLFANTVIKEIEGFETIGTSTITNLGSMFENCKEMTSIDLGEEFDTEKVTNMSKMFNGCIKATTINLGNNFNTENVTDMSYMFNGCSSLTGLVLDEKFKVSKVTNMNYMFNDCTKMQTLDLGKAFTQISGKNTNFVTNLGKSATNPVIYVGEAIYKDVNNLRLNASSSTNINYSIGKVECKYQIVWTKTKVEMNETEKTLSITLKATGKNTTYKTSTLSKDNIHVYVDGVIADDGINVEKVITNKTETDNSVEYTLILTSFEQKGRQADKKYKEWSGNVSIKIDGRTAQDEYGNGNLEKEIKDTNTDKNKAGVMYADFIKPEITYKYSEKDVDTANKTVKVVFTVADKYYASSTLQLSNLKVIMHNEINNKTQTINSSQMELSSKDLSDGKGKEYTLIINGPFENNMVGHITIEIPEGVVLDKSGNKNI